MLSLDDPKWTELKGGFGPLYNPTAALRKLEAGDQIAAAWDDLWNNLHHQGDVGEASYAAVPHLVRIQQEKRNLDWNLYALIATIEVARHAGANPPMPDWLKADYGDAWKVLTELAIDDLRAAADQTNVRARLMVVALGKGLRSTGALLTHHGDNEIREILQDRDEWY
jgi:hypothetical protein